MPKRGAGQVPDKKDSEESQGISVLDLPEDQLQLDTDDGDREGDSEDEVSSDDAADPKGAFEEQDVSDAEAYLSADEVEKSVLDLMQGQQEAKGPEEELPQDRSDRTAEAGTSDAPSDSDSSEDERPSRNTGVSLQAGSKTKPLFLHLLNTLTEHLMAASWSCSRPAWHSACPRTFCPG